ncbi:MAG: O-acetyl-ADP-ribose deacetylase [Myxococcales bacterium]|nr:O-acetyl-ADP-ribose deacetylase [Myxococcales bacterium]
MERRIGKTTIVIIQGDITQQTADAIVNAAQSSLMGGGGVDGAIHRVGGPEILEDCKKVVSQQGEAKTGQAVSTCAGKLNAKRVIHTVGPIWRGGTAGEHTLLERCYTNSLAVARAEGLRTVAFPSISTGAYRFPIDRASFVAINTILRNTMEFPDAFDEIRMVTFSAADYDQYSTTLDEAVRTMIGTPNHKHKSASPF